MNNPLSLFAAHNLNATDAQLTITRSMRKGQATITAFTGFIGSGKTTLAAQFYKNLTHTPHRLNIGLIDCGRVNPVHNPKTPLVPFKSTLRKLQLHFHHIIIVMENHDGEDLKLIRHCAYAGTQINVIHLP